MTAPDSLAELRQLFLTAPELGNTRFVAVALALGLVLVVLGLVRRHHLRAEYAPIWMLVAAGILVVSVWPPLLRSLTVAIGAWTPSSTLFFFGQVFLIGICLSYAVRLSQASVRIKNLAQEVALLRARIEAAEAAARQAEPPGAGEAPATPADG